MSPTRRSRRAPWLVALSALVLVGLGDDAATITVEEVHPAPPAVHYIVRVTTSGGDPVTGATVTAVPTGPDGDKGSRITLEPVGDGRYQGAVEMPEDGTWSVTFTSTDPAATLDHSQTIPVGGTEDHDGNSYARPLALGTLFLLTLAGMALWSLIDRRRARSHEE